MRGRISENHICVEIYIQYIRDLEIIISTRQMNNRIISLEIIHGLNMLRDAFKEKLVSKQKYLLVTQKMITDNFY